MANSQLHSYPAYSIDSFKILLSAQIENSLDLNWKKEDLIILSNFNFEYMGVKTTRIPLNNFCLTGSKMFGIKWFFENNDTDEIVWSRDCDTWQNVEFSEKDLKYGENHFSGKNPNIIDFNKYDVGASYYSREKFNGGSLFWKLSALDIINRIVDEITKSKENKEEPTINRMFKSVEYKDRVANLSYSLNLGCSGFCPRYERAEKPIKICHMNVRNRLAWETHVLDRNGLGENNIPVGRRLERLIRKYYPNLAIKLKNGIRKKGNVDVKK